MSNRTGKSGPPRKPTALKLLHGTFRADTAAKSEPVPESDPNCPAPPDYLSELAKVEWKRLATELHPLGLLTRVDGSALEFYCEAYARWREAGDRDDLRNEKAFAQLAHRFLTEFGMTPASRSRINVLTEDGGGTGKKHGQDKNFA